MHRNLYNTIYTSPLVHTLTTYTLLYSILYAILHYIVHRSGGGQARPDPVQGQALPSVPQLHAPLLPSCMCDI